MTELEEKSHRIGYRCGVYAVGREMKRYMIPVIVDRVIVDLLANYTTPQEEQDDDHGK